MLEGAERLGQRTTFNIEDPIGPEVRGVRAKEACPIPCWCCGEYESYVDACCWPLEPRYFEHICVSCLREIRGFNDSAEEKERFSETASDGNFMNVVNDETPSSVTSS